MSDTSHRSIGEVLSLLKQDHPDITISKIRFLESQGLISPERTPSGYRKFFAADVDRLRWILEQQRDNFLPLKVIKRRLESGAPESMHEPANAPTTREPTLFSQRDEPVESTIPAASADQAAAAASPSAVMPAETSARTAPTPSARAAAPGSVSLTTRELSEAVGVKTITIDELRRIGLIEPISSAGGEVYDHEALIVAKAAATILRSGLEPRHLRMFKVAAEHQAGVYEQLFGARARHSVESATQARAELKDLVELGEVIQRSVMRRNLGTRLRQP